MAILKNTSYLIIIILFGFIVYLKQCSKPKIIEHRTVVTIRDTITDTIQLSKVEYIPKITEIEKIIYLPVDVDTFAILQDYFIKRFYADTILSDSNGFFAVYDTIYQNRIWKRYTKTEIYQKQFYETTTITQTEKRKNKLFLGIELTNKSGFSFNAMLMNKKENSYTIGYDILDREYKIGYYQKIRF